MARALMLPAWGLHTCSVTAAANVDCSVFAAQLLHVNVAQVV